MIIKGGLVFDPIKRDAYEADIRIEDGKFSEIGCGLLAKDGEEVIDAKGMRVYPGLVEAHCHVGLSRARWPKGDSDTNEKNDILTPQLRAIDGFDPRDTGIDAARRAGVTTLGVGPGSANIVSGTFMAVKTYGVCVDKMVVKSPVAMKCAFGENPKNWFGTKCDSSRLTTAAKLRELLFMTQEYLAKKESAEDASKLPKFDMKLEAMIPVIKGELPLKAHAHSTNDICTAIRIAKEFGVKLTLEHVTAGHLIPDEIYEAGAPVAIGPSMCGTGKVELFEKNYITPGVLASRGVEVSIITDAPVIPIENLPIAAGVAVKYGMDKWDALRAITINPAKHLGIEDRVGSIEVGQDADLIICDGDVMSNLTKVSTVIIDGKVMAI